MSAYLDALHATWPAVREWSLGGFTLRDGGGAGKRASAATLNGPVEAADLPAAEAAMQAAGATPLFMVRSGEDALDKGLSDRGYKLRDPSAIYAGPVAPLAAVEPPRVSSFTIWPPLAIMHYLWLDAGTGPERQALMDRVPQPKTAVLGRTKDQPAGAAFAAIHDGICMIHAFEVAEPLRRNGTATNMLRQAARWAQDNGATEIALAVTEENVAAKALYAALDMAKVDHYHYRSTE